MRRTSRKRTETKQASQQGTVFARKPESKKAVKGKKMALGYKLMTTTFYTIEGAEDSRLDGKYSNQDILDVAKGIKESKMSLKPRDSKLLYLLEDEQDAWDDEDGENFAPMQLINDWDNPKYAHHRERIERADLSYPLLVWHDLDEGGGYKVIDGMHRLAKAVLEKKPYVMVKELTTDDFLKLNGA